MVGTTFYKSALTSRLAKRNKLLFIYVFGNRPKSKDGGYRDSVTEACCINLCTPIVIATWLLQRVSRRREPLSLATKLLNTP